MALVLTSAPDSAPTSIADWNKINAVFQTIGNLTGLGVRVYNGYVLRGSVLFFSGAWYIADADTAITGTTSDYVAITNTAGVLTIAYAASLTGITWNKQWQGWYGALGVLYLFDEVKAFAAGLIDYPYSMKEFRPDTGMCGILSEGIHPLQCELDIEINTPSATFTRFNKTVSDSADAIPTTVEWIKFTDITFPVIGAGYKISAFSLRIQITEIAYMTDIRLMRGSTTVWQAAALTDQTITVADPLSVTTVAVNYELQFYGTGGDYYGGPFVTTVSLCQGDDTKPVNMAEYVFNVGGNIACTVTGVTV